MAGCLRRKDNDGLNRAHALLAVRRSIQEQEVGRQALAISHTPDVAGNPTELCAVHSTFHLGIDGRGSAQIIELKGMRFGAGDCGADHYEIVFDALCGGTVSRARSMC